MLKQKLKQQVKETFLQAFLPMCDKDGYIVGIFTANDIAETLSEILDSGLIKYTALFFEKEITEKFKPPKDEDVNELQTVIQTAINNLRRAISQRDALSVLQANAELQFCIYKFIVKQNISRINTEVYKLFLEFKTKSITLKEYTTNINNLLKAEK